ncbi:MAG: alkaline phosphatase family protein [Gemmatimonadetes bacterium]|nr:alkaline phosphatase family protein [Gemmatimonadota bacterium]
MSGSSTKQIWPLALALLVACAPERRGAEAPPRLAVVLVVDQMRADFLDRYEPLFEAGFARVLSEGAVFTRAEHDHATTVTAVGHATIATGSIPAQSGIVGNDFFDRGEGRTVYSASDPNAVILDYPDLAGRSAVRLRRAGLADWLKAARPESRVFSTALKDRSAIMMGGHASDGVYWYEGAIGTLVTSDYYRDDVPDWVGRFAARARAASYFSGGWDPLSASHPGRTGRAVSFSHRFSEMYTGGRPEAPDARYFVEFTDTPFSDEMILQFARTAVDEEGLGTDANPDLLLIGASAGDYIGHRWGPYSPEVRDYYVRLDRYLGRLFDFLDDRVGADRWTLVLTSDHGVTPPPEELPRGDARRIPEERFSEEVRAALVAAYADVRIEPAPRIRWQDGPHILSETATPAELRTLRRAIADRLAEIDFVAAAYTAEEVAGTSPRRGDMLGRFRRSFDADRSPDVMLRFERGLVVGETTATHGSPYAHDRHVPLVFMGPGIAPGRHSAPVRTVDIAPTLAALLGIPTPGDLDGRPIRKVAR